MEAEIKKEKLSETQLTSTETIAMKTCSKNCCITGDPLHNDHSNVDDHFYFKGQKTAKQIHAACTVLHCSVLCCSSLLANVHVKRTKKQTCTSFPWFCYNFTYDKIEGIVHAIINTQNLNCIFDFQCKMTFSPFKPTKNMQVLQCGLHM